MLVRGLEETSLEALRFAQGVVAVESRTPSLEEIFVGYMTPSSNTNAAPTFTTNLVEMGADGKEADGER